MRLSDCSCPSCGKTMENYSSDNTKDKKTTSFSTCYRTCNTCELGYSNSRTNMTVIYKDYLMNVPRQVHIL